MRLLMLVSSASWGGGQAVALGLCTALGTRGCAITLGAPGGGDLEWRASACAAPPAFVDLPLGTGLGPLVLPPLLALMRRGSFDLVHTHLTRAALWGSIAARLQGIPVASHAHGLDAHRYYRFAGRVLAVSEAVARHLGAGHDPRVSVCPPALSLPATDRARVAHLKDRLGEGRPLLVLAAALHPNKGQRIAVEALARLPDAILVLAGEGPDRRRIQRTIHAHGLNSRVHLLGFRSDVADLMAAASVVLVPSWREGFGLAAAEALMLGTPVVGTRTGGLEEVLGDAGGLIPPGDPGALADGIRQVLARGAAARTEALERGKALLAHYTIERAVQCVETCYAAMRRPAAG